MKHQENLRERAGLLDKYASAANDLGNDLAMWIYSDEAVACRAGADALDREAARETLQSTGAEQVIEATK